MLTTRIIGLLGAMSVGCFLHPGPPAPPPLTGHVRIANPIRTGSVMAEAAPVVVTNMEEQIYRLPSGSLSHEGRIESMSEDKTCFVVTIRQLGGRAKWVDVENWTVSLVVDDTKKLSVFQKARLGGKAGAVDGRTIQVEQVGSSLACSHANAAGKCDEHAIVAEHGVTERDASISLADATTRLCFDTKGAVAKTSRSVLLDFQAPPGFEPPESFRMRWDLD